MQRTTSIARSLKLGGLALVAAGSLLLSTAAAEGASSHVVGGHAAANAAKADLVAASDRGKRSSKRRKRCKRPKVAVRRNGRIRCVRPKKKTPAPPPTAVPAPQQAPSSTNPQNTNTTGGSAEGDKPTAHETSQLESQVRSYVIGGTLLPREFVGCFGPFDGWWGGYYAYCEFIDDGGYRKTLTREFYYWDFQQIRWIYWYSEENLGYYP